LQGGVEAVEEAIKARGVCSQLLSKRNFSGRRTKKKRNGRER
jgi:hypothetical protein